jgi:glycosidase
MWANESVFYQIYPLGFCGAPLENDGVCKPRIQKVKEWVPHMEKLGINAIYFSPLFESDTHGYNTRDFQKVDVRLGTNEDFKEVCEYLHKHEIRVVLDGVFHHVGRGFGPFLDVVKNRENSPYVSWFAKIDFNGDSNYHDGLWYEGWEGNYDLVKLNLYNPEVVQYLLDSVAFWVKEFDIDGIRLDVAYSLEENFLRRLRQFTKELKPDFFLVGEILHGDYNRIMNDQMLDSVTNYECYKGLYSSLNSQNLFEISYSLQRQFGPDNWTLYKGKHLLSFVDNHDVTRIASILTKEEYLPLVYGLLFGMPGIPCIYYGSEWGAKGEKKDGDPALRVSFPMPIWNELTDQIGAMIQARLHSDALLNGSFRVVMVTNQQFIFERKTEGERVLVGVNVDAQEYVAHFDAGCGTAIELLTGKKHDFGGGSRMPGYSVSYWLMEK